MLESVGVEPVDERAYRALLGLSAGTVGDLAAHVGRDERSVRKSVHRLEELGLLSRTMDKPPQLVPARPDVAIEVLVARRRAELDQAQASARVLLDEMQTQERQRPENLVEVIVGRHAIATRFAQLLQTTDRELLILDRPPYASDTQESDSTVRGLLREGVRVFGIYSPDSLALPGGVNEAYSAAEAGETSRVHPQVPMKLAVADRSLALLPLAVENMTDSALVVRRCGLLDALVEMFALLWEQALPIIPAVGDQADDPHGTMGAEPDPRLLTMLAAGLKDDAIARQLDMSSRTVGRRVAALMEMLGARTRFQAGVHAQRRRLLGGQHDDAAGQGDEGG